MKLKASLQKFGTWPPNYKFAYLLVLAGVIFCALMLIVSNQPAEGQVLLGLGLIVCIGLSFFMPGWALNDEEEKSKRAWRK